MKPRRRKFGLLLDYLERVTPILRFWPSAMPSFRRHSEKVLRNEEALNQKYLAEFRETERRERNNDG